MSTTSLEVQGAHNKWALITALKITIIFATYLKFKKTNNFVNTIFIHLDTFECEMFPLDPLQFITI